LKYLLYGENGNQGLEKQFFSVNERVYNHCKIKQRTKMIVAFVIGVAGSLVANYLIKTLF